MFLVSGLLPRKLPAKALLFTRCTYRDLTIITLCTRIRTMNKSYQYISKTIHHRSEVNVQASKDLQCLELNSYHDSVLVHVCGQTLHVSLTVSTPLSTPFRQTFEDVRYIWWEKSSKYFYGYMFTSDCLLSVFAQTPWKLLVEPICQGV